VTSLTLRPVTRENWVAALELTVRPDQQHFVADYAPVAAIALAKAYVRAGGATWAPYAIYDDETIVGFVTLAYEPDSTDYVWFFHFFIDQRFQGRGYGKAALEQLVALVRREHPQCHSLRLTVHPENYPAQRLYTAAGFRPTGAERWGEREYVLSLHSTR
jgi:diamine N-acetyltransferase